MQSHVNPSKEKRKSLKIKAFLMLIFFVAFTGLNAQVAINEDDSDADPTAALDVKSTTKGVIFPKLSETERDNLPSPAEGLMIFNRTVGYFNYYNGTNWCLIDRTLKVDPAVNPAGTENDNGVGIGIDDPDNSAILHVNHNEKGVLMPRLNSSTITGAPEGMIFYYDNYFRYYDGTAWQDMMGTAEGPADGGSGTAEGVVIGNSSVDASAKLEIYSTDKGLLVPRMTSAQRDVVDSPAEGLLLYNLDDHEFQYFADNKWYAWTNNTGDYGTEDNPGTSCNDILTNRPSATDGNYYIDPDGIGGDAAFECYCDMTTDDGGWTLITSNSGNPDPDLFTTTTVNRDPSSGNVYTDLTINSGTWYSHLRWGPASTRSSNWSHVTYPVYNAQSSDVLSWFQAVGNGGGAFTPAIDYKCTWGDSYVSLGSTTSNYQNDFPSNGWNIPDPSGGSSWDGVLPGIHLGNGQTLSDTHGVGGYDCNPGDARTTYIQLWVK